MKITFLLAAAALAPAALALPLPRGPSVRFPGPAILAATTPGVPPPAPAVHRPFALARDLPQRLYPDSHPDYEVAKEAWAGTPRVPCRFTWRQRHSDALAVWLVLAFFAVIVAVETVGAVCARLMPARVGAIRLPEPWKAPLGAALSVKAEADVDVVEVACRDEDEVQKV